MTPIGWIALAYSIVFVTLIAYVLSLRRRLRDATRTRGTSTQHSASIR